MEKLDDKYERAAKRVKELKSLYRHLQIFLLVNGVLYLLKSGVLNPLMPEGFPTEHYYFDWVDSNVFIWGLILAVHALYTFRNRIPFLQKWEEHQIQKYMEREDEEMDKFK